MPDRPAWPAEPELLAPNRMPKRGKGGSERGRVALLHALAHIEFVAIDLAVDLVGRFGGEFPRAFVDDWIGVAADEAMRSEEHTSELQSLMRISYAVFCLKKKKQTQRSNLPSNKTYKADIKQL